MADIKVNTELCIGCRLCAIVCSEGALTLAGDHCAVPVEPDKCIECMECEEECAVSAIKIS